MTSTPNVQNVPPVNEADKSDWPTIGCRIRPSDLFFVDRAVLEIKRSTGRTNYTRSDYIAEAVIAKAVRLFGEEAETIRATA